MASVYDLDELVQLVALHLGDYGNLGHIYQLMDQPTILCITYICIPLRLEQECKQCSCSGFLGLLAPCILQSLKYLKDWNSGGSHKIRWPMAWKL